MAEIEPEQRRIGEMLAKFHHEAPLATRTGGGENKDESGERTIPEYIDPSEHTLQLVRRLNRLGFTGINAPALPSNSRDIELLLKQNWDGGAFSRCKYVQREMQRGKLRNPHEYYNSTAEWNAYHAFGQTPETLQVMGDYGSLEEMLMNLSNLRLTRITESGCANSYILRQLKARRQDLIRSLITRLQMGADFEEVFARNKKNIPKHRALDFFLHSTNNFTNLVDDFEDLDLTGIDYASAYPSLLTNTYKINGVQADMCLPWEQLASLRNEKGRRLLLPNSDDQQLHLLVDDRIEDWENYTDNSRRMAKLDGSTRFLRAVIFPFSNVSDAMMKRGKPMKFWDRKGDPRDNWIVKEKGPWTPEDCARSIERMVFTLAQHGFAVKNIGVQPHVVCSPHSLITDAGVLRQEYQHLLQPPANGVCAVSAFTDYSCQILADVFQKAVLSTKGEMYEPQRMVPDRERIGLPQEYQAYLLAGNIVEPIECRVDESGKIAA